MQPDQASAMPGCETIEELFAALESPLLSYALRLSGGLSTAEDLVQEAFMKLQAQFKDVREPRRWLYQTVHNLAMNQRRQAKNIISLDANGPAARNGTGDPADPKPLPDEQLARMEGIGLVRLKAGHVGYLLHCALKSMADELARNGVFP
jgi:DNA-directed RNA polymerase specialized sigma24 family protein